MTVWLRPWVRADHARKLERQLNAARKALREIVEITDRYSDSALRTGVIKKVATAGLSPENMFLSLTSTPDGRES